MDKGGVGSDLEGVKRSAPESTGCNLCACQFPATGKTCGRAWVSQVKTNFSAASLCQADGGRTPIFRRTDLVGSGEGQKAG